MLLNLHSAYSLKYGMLMPDNLLQLLKLNDYSIAALTDINNTSACLDFCRLAPKYAIKPVVGVDFRNRTKQQFVGLAANQKGYAQLNAFLSFQLHSGNAIPDKAPPMQDVFIIYPFRSFSASDNLAENEYIGVKPADLNRLRFSAMGKYKDKLVVLQTTTFRNSLDFNSHRLLRAIDNNTLLSRLSKEEEASPDDVLLSRKQLVNYYAEFPELIKNTQKLLEQCHADFQFHQAGSHGNQQAYTGNATGDRRLLLELCQEGMPYRYPVVTDQINQRLQKEIEIIEQKGFLSYFLINWDIVRFARHKNFFYVGRGSGANSIIAYLLRITDVDPIELDLYFERFINLYRKNPPDFDIDFSWTDREAITDYIFQRFTNVSLLGAYSTFQYRAVVRELGKVFGLPPHEIDALSNPRSTIVPKDKITELILRYGTRIQNLPSHISIHSSGILITEHPITQYCATFLPPKGYPTTQFDMVVAEDAGLYKFDILSQRGLGKIKDTLQIVKTNTGDDIDIHNIKAFKQDEGIKELLREGKAIGCFYVESPAMRMLLKKLRVDDYLGLVAASSIIRPGVSKSGMMREYIQRHRYPERRKDAHPVMLDIMPDTYGVMVYQEDVIKVAHYFAGLSLAEADVLRRGMSGKYRSREEFAQVEAKYYSNCREKGYPDALAKEIWRQIESFAGYAFAKGHSASYAVESYQSLFLKAYYPLEYMVATINNFGGFYATEHYVHEARMGGADIQPPCINRSDYHTVIEHKIIYLGLMHLSGLETEFAEKLLTERDKNGLFKSLEDFMERLHATPEQMSILIRIDAFRFTKRNKRELLWEMHLRLNKDKPSLQKSLFKAKQRTFQFPKFINTPQEDAFDQFELLGFSLCNPFDLLSEIMLEKVLAQDLAQFAGKELCIWGYLVTVKDTRTSKGERMNFGTFLDYEGNFFDTVHFPDVAKAFPFRGKGVYAVSGTVCEEFGFYSIEVKHMRKINLIEDPRYARNSRPNITTKQAEFISS